MGASRKIIVQVADTGGASERVLVTNAVEVAEATTPATGDVPARQADGSFKFQPQSSGSAAEWGSISGTLTNQTDLNLALTGKQATSAKNQASGYAGLDANTKINPLQLPSIAITDTFVVATQVAMLALDAQTGDVAIRTDLSKSYILQGDDPTELTDWQELRTPTDAVSTVFGRSGTVTAQASDYDAIQIDNDSDVTGSTVKDALNNLNALKVDSISGDIETADDKTYVLDQYAAYAYTINNLYIKSSSGTCTAKLTIDGSDVTGISSVSVSSSEASAEATAANAVSVGNTVALVISSNSSAEDVSFTVKITRG
jgi:hypothetical protein